MEVAELIKRLLKEIHTISKTETVVGEPLVVGDSKIIPISKLSLGFGVGGLSTQAEGSGPESGEAATNGGGAGGGVKVQPVAFVVVDPQGGAQLLCLDEPESSVIDKILSVAPELVDRITGKVRTGKVIDAPDEDAPTVEAPAEEPGEEGK